MGTHRKVIGVMHLVLGVFALLPLMVCTAIFGGVWGLAAYFGHGDPAVTVLGVGLATLLMIVAITVGVGAVLGLLAGAGVLLGRKWGDVLATIAAVFHVFNVPFGTMLAVYTFYGLWVAEPAPLRALPVPDHQPSPVA